MKIVNKSFHVIDMNQETVSSRDVQESLNPFIQDYFEYVQKDERKKSFQVKDTSLVVADAISRIVMQKDSFEEMSNRVAEKLLEAEKMVEGKIYPMDTHVRKGSLLQAVFLMDDETYRYLIAKVEYSQWFDGANLSTSYGFSEDKKNIWKYALFNIYEINDHIIFDDVKVYNDTKAKYWTVSFLELDEKRDDAKNTYKAYQAVDTELKSAILPHSKRDYVCLSEKLQETMNTPHELSYIECVDSLMDSYDPAVEEIQKDVIKESLMALPSRKKFDSNFQVIPSSITNKRTKKFKIAPGVELHIESQAKQYTKRIVSTMSNGHKVLQIICDDDDTYDAFIEE